MHAVSALRRVGGFLFSGDGRYHGAARFNGETDGGSVFAIDDDVGKEDFDDTFKQPIDGCDSDGVVTSISLSFRSVFQWWYLCH